MAELVQNLGSFVPDNLIVDGSVPILTKAVTLEAGQGTLQRGTVLGKVTKAIGEEVVGPGEEKGTIGIIVLGKIAKLGTYTLTCTTATATAQGVPAVFEVIDPDGIRLGDAVAGEAYTGPINFTITEDAGFAEGDVFTVTVIAGSGKYKKADSTNVDGSQVADCILADNVDTALDVTAIAYKTGHFNRKALIVGDSDTVDMHEDKLRELGIFLSDNVPY